MDPANGQADRVEKSAEAQRPIKIRLSSLAQDAINLWRWHQTRD